MDQDKIADRLMVAEKIVMAGSEDYSLYAKDAMDELRGGKVLQAIMDAQMSADMNGNSKAARLADRAEKAYEMLMSNLKVLERID